MKKIELDDGEVIENVTRVAQSDGYLHIHTPGSGYRVVSAERVVRGEDAHEGSEDPEAHQGQNQIEGKGGKSNDSE